MIIILALVKGTQTCAVKQTEGIISWDITVDGNRLIIIANGDFTYEFELNDKYTGGYVSFSSANSYNIFNPPVIKELTKSRRIISAILRDLRVWQRTAG